MLTSSIPAIWQTAIITPIFKSGSPNEANNYRPISQTYIASKITETIIKDNMLDHLIRINQYTVNNMAFWLVSRLIHTCSNRVMTMPIWILLKHPTLLCTTS